MLDDASQKGKNKDGGCTGVQIEGRGAGGCKGRENLIIKRFVGKLGGQLLK